MKKLLVLAALIIASLCLLASCGGQKDEHIHEFGEWDVTEKPTCSEKGTKVRYCSCGETQKASIPSTEHNIVSSSAIEATCTSTGLTEGKYCSICNEIIVAQSEIPKTSHIEEVVSAVESTCIENGLTEGKRCSVCSTTLIAQQKAPLKAHVEIIDQAIAATCTKTGLTEGKHCSTCGTITIAQQVTSVVAHTYDDKYDESCNNCGFIRDAECAHKETETLKGYAATCTSAGLTDGKKCKNCNEILTAQVAINIVPHAEVIDKAVTPTCTSTGLTEGKHCSACTLILVAQTVIPAKEHTEVIDPAIEPTCTKTGLTEGKHCSVCNVVIVSQSEVAMIEHNESDWIIEKEPTDIEKGYKYKVCGSCGKKTVEEDIPCLTDIGLSYTVNSNGTTCTVTGIGSFSGDELVIPQKISGYTVTAIGEEAFENCANLTKIVIPETTESIGTRAFYGCTGITEITIPQSVYNIGTQIFYKASNLATVYYNSTYGSQENQFMNYSHITKIVFGGNCVPCICYNNTAVKTVEILDSVTFIAYNAFEGCTNLANVVIPDSVTHIYQHAFEGCTSLTNVVIPNSVTYLDSDAFYGCTNLANITISNNATSIGLNTFYDCSSLTSIVIPNSVTSIGASAFFGCTSLANIVIPDSITNIENQAFYGCTNLSSIVIPDSVTSVNYGAFRNCSSLVNIVIPDSVTSIGDYAFRNCTNLPSITIPNSVTNIGNYAFYDCTTIVSITYDGTVEQWKTLSKGNSWDYRTGDYTVYCTDGKIAKDGTVSYYNTESVGLKFTSNGDGTCYVSGIGACQDTDLVIPMVSPDGYTVTGIADRAFMNNRTITSLVIPDTVTYVGTYAFYDCTALTHLSINGVQTELSYGAFYYCGSLKDIYINSTLTTLGEEAFNNAGFGADVVFGKNVTAVPQNLFRNSDIKSVKFEKGSVCTTIGNYAFYYCEQLISVELPEKLTSIGTNAFYSCKKLYEIINHSKLNIIAGNNDYGSIALNAKNIHTGESKVVIVDNFVFYHYNGENHLISYCGIQNSRDREFALPESFNGSSYMVDTNALPIYMGSLKTLIIPSAVKSIDYAALTDINAGSDFSIILYVGLTSVGSNAFSYSNVKNIYFTGTEDDFAKIDWNIPDSWSGTIHYNYVPEN